MMANTKIKIIFRGVGLMYKATAENTWMVVFPFDDCHRVKFSSEKNGTGEFTNFNILAGTRENVVFETDGSFVSQSGDASFASLGLLDLNADTDYPQVNFDKTYPDKVIVTMQNVSFGTALESIENFVLVEKPDPSGPFDEQLRIVTKPRIYNCHYAFAEVEMQEGSTLKIVADGDVIYESTPGSNEELCFDNDCWDHIEPDSFENDFNMVYHLIKPVGDIYSLRWVEEDYLPEFNGESVAKDMFLNYEHRSLGGATPTDRVACKKLKISLTNSTFPGID